MRKRDVREELEQAGYEHGDEVPVRVAAELWDISPGQVRQLGIDPARVEKGNGETWTFFSYEQVVELADDPRVVAARRRHQQDREDNWDPPADWRETLPIAALAFGVIGAQGYLQGRETQSLVRNLRPRFLRCLWEHGYCSSVAQVTQIKEEHICELCRGVGCEVCDQTGIWWPRREVEMYLFTFDLPEGSIHLSASAGQVPWVPENMVTGSTQRRGDGVLDPDPWHPWQYQGDEYVAPAAVPIPPTRAYRILQWTIEQAEKAA